VDDDEDRPRITGTEADREIEGIEVDHMIDPDLLDVREHQKRLVKEALLLLSHQPSLDQPPATRAAADHEIDLALETDRLRETEASPDLARDPDLAPDRKILPCTSIVTHVFLPNFSNLLK